MCLSKICEKYFSQPKYSQKHITSKKRGSSDLWKKRGGLQVTLEKTVHTPFFNDSFRINLLNFDCKPEEYLMFLHFRAPWNILVSIIIDEASYCRNLIPTVPQKLFDKVCTYLRGEIKLISYQWILYQEGNLYQSLVWIILYCLLLYNCFLQFKKQILPNFSIFMHVHGRE